MSSRKRVGETSYKETVFGIIPRSKLIPLEIEGIKRAWDFVLDIHGRGLIPITAVSLKKIHRIGFGWIFPEFGGVFRKVEVIVSKHTPPQFYQIPQMMEDLVRDIQVRVKYLPKVTEPEFFDTLVEFLAWAHHRFLWIHPFQDYNGRIGRLLISIILLNLNLPPIELKVETSARRKKYISALQEADRGEHRKLQKMIREAVEEATLEFFK
jgi:Fic family protein